VREAQTNAPLRDVGTCAFTCACLLFQFAPDPRSLFSEMECHAARWSHRHRWAWQTNRAALSYGCRPASRVEGSAKDLAHLWLRSSCGQKTAPGCASRRPWSRTQVTEQPYQVYTVGHEPTSGTGAKRSWPQRPLYAVFPMTRLACRAFVSAPSLRRMRPTRSLTRHTFSCVPVFPPTGNCRRTFATGSRAHKGGLRRALGDRWRRVTVRPRALERMQARRSQESDASPASTISNAF